MIRGTGSSSPASMACSTPGGPMARRPRCCRARRSIGSPWTRSPPWSAWPAGSPWPARWAASWSLRTTISAAAPVRPTDWATSGTGPFRGLICGTSIRSWRPTARSPSWPSTWPGIPRVLPTPTSESRRHAHSRPTGSSGRRGRRWPWRSPTVTRLLREAGPSGCRRTWAGSRSGMRPAPGGKRSRSPRGGRSSWGPGRSRPAGMRMSWQR